MSIIQIQTHAAALNLLLTSKIVMNAMLVLINQATTAMIRHVTVKIPLCISMGPIVVDALTLDSISEIAISALIHVLISLSITRMIKHAHVSHH